MHRTTMAEATSWNLRADGEVELAEAAGVIIDCEDFFLRSRCPNRHTVTGTREESDRKLTRGILARAMEPAKKKTRKAVCRLANSLVLSSNI